MNTILKACQGWIDRRYAECFPNDPALHRWHPAGLDFQTVEESTATTLILEDQELGLLLILIPLEEVRDMRSRIDQDLHQALSLRSRLLPANLQTETSGVQQGDRERALGSWRVALHWLVPEEGREAWEASVRHVRGQSSAFDDIPVDGITHGDSIEEALEEHRLPRLLFETRQVFRKSSSEVTRWSSADDHVRDALRGFTRHFHAPREREIARGLEELAESFRAAQEKTPSSTPELLSSVHIRDVRAVRSMRLESLDTPERTARASVIHGPNGAGKSTLAEALSLRFFKSSQRFAEYLDDPDVTSGKSSEGYITGYLRNIQPSVTRTSSPSSGGPSVGINGDWMPIAESLAGMNKTSAKEALILAEGTLASQDGSIELVKLKGPELATRLSRHLSKLAEKAVDRAEAGFSEAKQRRSEFTGQFGMTANTKLEETIRRKIAERHLSEALPKPDARTLAFLQLRAVFQDGDGRKAADLLTKLDGMQALEATLKRLLKLDVDADGGLSVSIRDLLQERSHAIREANGLVRSFCGRADMPDMERKDLRNQAEQWSAWLTKPRSGLSQDPSDPGREEREQRLNALFQARNEVRKLGESLSARHNHLSNAKTFIETHWKREHPQTCPTCQSDFTQGIEAVIESLFSEVDRKINEYRDQYKALSGEIQSLETALKVSNQTRCPIPESGRKRIERWIASVVDSPIPVEAALQSSDWKESTLRLFQYLESPPGITPETPGLDGEARRLADGIRLKWAEAREQSEAPDAWESVYKRLKETLKEVVESHLPGTFQRVWHEIMSNLRPGPWMLPGVPEFQTDLQRGKQRIDVVIGPEGPLARYLLNGAEMHTLGLAWFFTRHLTESRFRNAWMLLDDPAREMDQPTFRELCRFLAALRRIYEFYGQRRGEEHVFTLLVLLHQEERALDLAREMDCGLHLLGWGRIQDDEGDAPTIRRLLLAGPGYENPQPDSALSQAG